MASLYRKRRKNTLRKYGFTDNKRVFNVGTSLEYEQVFKRIITELQRCQDNYEEMLMLLLRHLLIIFNRKITTEHVIRNEFLDSQMDTAITYFNTNYNRAINVEEYASSIGMSISWFIRSFRKYTGNTPVQFLTALRMTNAQVLLETTSYSINEIAGIVGYNNPLYFSRLFHKQKDVLLLNTEPEIHNKKTKAGANAPALSGLSKNLNHSYQNHIVPSAIL